MESRKIRIAELVMVDISPAVVDCAAFAGITILMEWNHENDSHLARSSSHAVVLPLSINLYLARVRSLLAQRKWTNPPEEESGSRLQSEIVPGRAKEPWSVAGLCTIVVCS